MIQLVSGRVQGQVQGVGFRAHVKQAAVRLGVSGYALNLPDGQVEVLLCGPRESVEQVQQSVSQGPHGARVDNIGWQTLDPSTAGQVEGFRIG